MVLVVSNAENLAEFQQPLLAHFPINADINQRAEYITLAMVKRQRRMLAAGKDNKEERTMGERIWLAAHS